MPLHRDRIRLNTDFSLPLNKYHFFLLSPRIDLKMLCNDLVTDIIPRSSILQNRQKQKRCHH